MVKAFILGGIVAGLFIFFFGCAKFEVVRSISFYCIRLLLNISSISSRFLGIFGSMVAVLQPWRQVTVQLENESAVYVCASQQQPDLSPDVCVCAGSTIAYLRALQRDSPQMWPASLVRHRMRRQSLWALPSWNPMCTPACLIVCDIAECHHYHLRRHCCVQHCEPDIHHPVAVNAGLHLHIGCQADGARVHW
jgi:hypothetical protein